MRNIILLLSIFFCGYGATADKPYEATWLRLSKVEGGYVLYNFPNLWPSDSVGKRKSHDMIKVQGNQLTYITYSEEAVTFSFDTAKRRDDDIYFFQAESSIIGIYCFLFQWVDKEKHIAKWSMSYYDKCERTPRFELYTDSLYNTFPIIDYERQSCKDGDECCD